MIDIQDSHICLCLYENEGWMHGALSGNSITISLSLYESIQHLSPLSDWIKSLSSDAVASFLRAVALGEELDEPWIVCSSAAYVWNYNNHVLGASRHSAITDSLTVLLDGLKKVGHAG